MSPANQGSQAAGIDLPPDWWRRRHTCHLLTDWFSPALLGLLLSYRPKDRTPSRQEIATGFLVSHQDTLLWLTAGHVVDKLNAILSDAEVLMMSWLDRCEIPGAQAVVVHDRNLLTFSASDQGIDLGAVAIAGLDRANIIAGGSAAAITERNWEHAHRTQADAYYMLGYPQEWLAVERSRVSTKQVKFSATLNPACLPIQRIPHRAGGEPPSFWDDPEAFYGKVLAFADDPSGQPDSIVGMSGAPVLSVELKPDAKLRFRLVAVQSKWLSRSRTVRAVSVDSFVAMIGRS